MLPPATAGGAVAPDAPPVGCSGRVVGCTLGVVATQLAFVITAYGHALASGELSRARFHISAVLDDDARSWLCALVGLSGMCTMLLLELLRARIEN